MQFDDPQDRKALVMGLALHEQGKQSLEKVDQPCACCGKAIMSCAAICSAGAHILLLKLAQSMRVLMSGNHAKVLQNVVLRRHSKPLTSLHCDMQFLLCIDSFAA